MYVDEYTCVDVWNFGTCGVLMMMMILFILAIGHKNDSEQKRTRGDKIT